MVDHVAALSLRGSFALPSLRHGGRGDSIHRLGSGISKARLSLDDEHELLVARGGAMAFGVRNGQVLWEIDCPCHCGAVSPARDILALGGNECIYLWDLKAGKLIRCMDGHRNDADVVNLWPHGASSSNNRRRSDDGEILDIAFSPDGSLLASACADKTVRLWDVMSGQQVGVDSSCSDRVTSVAFSHDGRYLACAAGYSAHSWNVTGGEYRSFSAFSEEIKGADPPSRAHTVTFSPDGRLLAVGVGSGFSHGVLWLWEIASGRLMHRLEEGHNQNINVMAFNPRGDRLVSWAGDGKVRLWNVASGIKVDEVEQGRTRVTISADGNSLVGGVAPRSKPRTFSGAPVWQARDGHAGPVSSLAFSPNGLLLASGGWEGVRLWDMSTGKEVGCFPEDPGSETKVAFSPSGRIVAAASQEAIRLLDIKSGSEVFRLEQGFMVRGLQAMALSSDGRLLAAGGHNVRLWDVEKRSELTRPPTPMYGANCLAFSPDGQTLAIGGGEERTILWDIGKGREKMVLQGWKSVAFSCSGRLLATGDGFGAIRLWQTDKALFGQRFRELRQLRSHTAGVNSLAFSPDSRFLASGGSDRAVGMWDVLTGEELMWLTDHTGSVRSVCFSPDGKYLASGSDDGTIRVRRAV